MSWVERIWLRKTHQLAAMLCDSFHFKMCYFIKYFKMLFGPLEQQQIYIQELYL